MRRLVSGTTPSAALTGTFGTNETDNTYLNHCNSNDSVKFMGDKYTVNTDSSTSIVIRKRPRAGGVITVAHTITGTGFTPKSRTGLWEINTGQTSYLCVVYVDATGPSLKMSRTSDGTTWDNFTLNTGTQPSFISNLGAAVYRGLLVFGTDLTGGQIHMVDVQAASVAKVADGRASPFSGGYAICVFNNRLFVLCPASFFGPATLSEVTSATLVIRATVGIIMGNQGGLHQVMLRSVGNSHMVAIFLDASDGFHANMGWKASDITVSGNTFNVTVKNTLIPSSIRYAMGGANVQFYGFWGFTDNETDPTNPTLHIWYGGPYATGGVFYNQYIDSDSELAPTPTGISAEQYAFVVSQGGGEYINTSDSDFFIDDITYSNGSLPGRVLVSFTAWGGGGADKFLRGYYNSSENSDMVQMTLIGSATGGSAVRNGNQIEQITADGSTYTFEWAAVSDGQFNSQPENIILQFATA